MKSDWIQTFTGKKFFPLAPDENLISIEDIAHSLSMQCRYNGHTKHFYSVAEHSILLAYFYFELGCESKNKELAKYALPHDASEAYLKDIPRPLKQLPQFDFYRQAEKRLQSLIYLRFNLDPCEPAEISRADKQILGEEAEFLMSPLHPDWDIHGTGLLDEQRWMCPKDAETQFLQYFKELFEVDK